MVQFEDDSQFLVLWKDISPGETLKTAACDGLLWVGTLVGSRPLTFCSFTAALPGEELLCCVCRSETVAPGNRLVSCEKCRHGERAGYFDGAVALGLCSMNYVSCPGQSSPCHLISQYREREL